MKWCFLSNCQKDTLAIIYNRCVLININTSVYDMEIKSGWLWYIKKIDWSLQTNCIDILISSLLFDFNNDVLINSGVDQVRKLVKADKMAFIVLGFITRYPFRAMRRMLLFWPTDCRKRQSPVLCLHTPFPHGYKSIPRGFYNMVPFRGILTSLLCNSSEWQSTLYGT